MIPVKENYNSSRFSDFSVERYERDRAKVIRDAASRPSRGNVAVQQGRFMTHAALESLRDELTARILRKT